MLFEPVLAFAGFASTSAISLGSRLRETHCELKRSRGAEVGGKKGVWPRPSRDESDIQ